MWQQKCLLSFRQSFGKITRSAVTSRRRGVGSLPLWSESPGSVECGSRPVVVLFGYAGSPVKELEKYNQLYTRLGYTSISCILPIVHMFQYNHPKIVECAEEVMAEVRERVGAEEGRGWVAHTFSHNGMALYQRCFDIVQNSNGGEPPIKGWIIDSAPGPIVFRDLKWWNLTFKDPPLFLPIAFFFVNQANGIGLLENLYRIVTMIRGLRRNWRDSKSAPFPGSFATKLYSGDWPVMYLYSSGDKLIGWKYVEDTIAEKRKSRNVTAHNFVTSGHVAHYKRHPDKYQSLVKEFCGKL